MYGCRLLKPTSTKPRQQRREIIHSCLKISACKIPTFYEEIFYSECEFSDPCKDMMETVPE